MTLQRCFLSNLSKELSRGHVSFPQFLLLTYLMQHGRMTMSTVAERMGHSTAAATGLVDRLESLQYVKRKHDLKDRRKVFVSINPKGVSLVGRIREELAVNLRSISDELTSEEQKSWLRIYRKINQFCQNS